MNKRKLYENIINNVSRELKKALNEDFQFDDTEIADKLFELVKKDKQIQNIVKNATAEDWANVIRGMAKLIKSKKIGENPVKIANIVQLANAILNRGFDAKLQDKLMELGSEDIQYTSNFLATEIRKAFGEKIKSDKEAPQALESKKANEGEDCPKCGKNPCQCEEKQCSEKCEDNKKVNEARNYKRIGGFTKFLNENRRKGIRPGRKRI
jgi:membrane-associated HD superfamily phosphohydrolase